MLIKRGSSNCHIKHPQRVLVKLINDKRSNVYVFANSLLKAATTATATKTSPENISLFHLCCFATISTRSTYRETANYPATKLVGVALKLR